MKEDELRKFCLEKAIEIMSWRASFFFKQTPIELAEILYRYITTGEILPIELPGTRRKNPQGKALRVSTSQLHEKKRNFYLTKVVKKLITYSPRKSILRQTNRR